MLHVMATPRLRFPAAILCLFSGVAVTTLVALSGPELRRRYHFGRWKTMVLKGLADGRGQEARLSLTPEEGSTAMRHVKEFDSPEGLAFLMARVLQGGERDAVAASIALASLPGCCSDRAQDVAAIVTAHEQALRTRAGGPGSALLRRVVSDLYTHCKDPGPRVRNVQRTPAPPEPSPGS
jgi:hypothetical protein